MGAAHRTLAGVATFAIMTVGVGVGVGTATGAYAADPPDPAKARAVGQWVNHGGAADLKALGKDFTDLEAAANASDLTRMAAGCDALLIDVNMAQIHDPIPDTQADKDWADALELYSQGALHCWAGAKTQDFSMINQASDEIIKGSASLDRVTARLKVIAGD